MTDQTATDIDTRLRLATQSVISSRIYLATNDSPEISVQFAVNHLARALGELVGQDQKRLDRALEAFREKFNAGTGLTTIKAESES